MIERPQVHICGLCKRPLDYMEPNALLGTPGRWHHSAKDQGPDHESMPMTLDEIDVVIPHCDFCFAEIPEGFGLYTLESKPFKLQIGNQISHMSALWAMCSPCVLTFMGSDDGITWNNEQDWDALQARMSSEHERRFPMPDEVLGAETEAMYAILLEGVREGYIEVRKAVGNELQEDAWKGMG